MVLPIDLTDPQTYPILPGISFFAKKTTTEGGDDEDDDEDEDDESFDTDADDKGGDDDEDDEDEDEGDDLPDTVKAILKKNRKATNDANKRARVAEGKLRDALKKTPKKAKADEEDDEDDDEKTARLTAPAIKLAKRTKAESALVRAGLSLGDNEDRSYAIAIKLLDLDDLDLDLETGQVHGLADAIADLKDDMPSLFVRSRSKRRINGDDDRGREPKPPKKLTASQQQAEALKPGSATGRR